MERWLGIVAIVIQIMAVSPTDYNITISKDCMERKGLCFEKPINYDQYLEAMEKSLRLSDLQLRSNEDYGQDKNESIDDGINCAFTREDRDPFVVVGKDTDVLVIQTEFFRQTVEYITCKGQTIYDEYESITGDGNCLQKLAMGWTGHCETKYTDVNLIVYNMKLKIVKPISARIPVSCYCSIRK